MMIVNWNLWQRLREHFSISDAIGLCEELVRRHPDSGFYWSILSRLHENAGNWPDALKAAQQAVSHDPTCSAGWLSLGHCYLSLGNLAEGRRCFETAIELGPSPDEQGERAVMPLFALGEYRRGWIAWARRGVGALEDATRNCPPFIRPLVGRLRWNGRPTEGRLLLMCENGHGDTFMILRWVPRILERVGALRLQVEPALIPLLAGQWPGVEVVSRYEHPGQFGVCTLSYNLPYLFGVQKPDDVSAPPYIRPLKPFRRLEGGYRVGIRWAGDPTHGSDVDRSTNLRDWAPVLSVPGVTFYSLQLDAAADQLRDCGVPIHDLRPELTDWERTAAAMAQLDLIISVDTSVAHLAGAMGRPVWICLPACPEWRWMLERSDTPWYGSARLFRQPRVGEWASVFAEMASALANLLDDQEIAHNTRTQPAPGRAMRPCHETSNHLGHGSLIL